MLKAHKTAHCVLQLILLEVGLGLSFVETHVPSEFTVLQHQPSFKVFFLHPMPFMV